MTCTNTLTQHPFTVDAQDRHKPAPRGRTFRPWGNRERPLPGFLRGTEGELLDARSQAVLGRHAMLLWRHLVDLRGTWNDHGGEDAWIPWTGSHVRDLLRDGRTFGWKERTLRSALDRLADAGLLAKKRPLPIRYKRKDGTIGHRMELEVLPHGASGLVRGVEQMWVPTGVNAWCRKHGRGGARPTRLRIIAAEIVQHYEAARADVEELADLYGRTPASIHRVLRKHFKAGKYTSKPRDPVTSNQIVSTSSSATSYPNYNMNNLSSPSEKKDPVPGGTGTLLASPGTRAEQPTPPAPVRSPEDLRLAALQLARRTEAHLRANPPTGTASLPRPPTTRCGWWPAGSSGTGGRTPR